MSAAYSAGWGATVELGAGQEHVRRELLASIRHPSRTWHTAPRIRELTRPRPRDGRIWTAVAHRELHRLAALGVIAIQTTRGRTGGVRFTFGVRYWRRSPIRRPPLLARMHKRAQVSFGQLTLELIPPVALTSPPDHAAGDVGSLPSVAGDTSTGQLELRLPRSFEELMALNGSGRRVLGW